LRMKAKPFQPIKVRSQALRPSFSLPATCANRSLPSIGRPLAAIFLSEAIVCGRQRQILIIFGSRSRERSGARPAMSLLSPYAGLTTAKCIGPVTNWVSGNRRVSIPSRFNISRHLCLQVAP
jgi:hypothetical protein